MGVPEDTGFYGEFTGEDEKAVLTIPQRITHAWATNDPDAFADTFTENGSVLLQDNQLTSREEIREYLRRAFEGGLAGARVTGVPLDVKFLAPGVAIAITEGGIVLPGETEIAPERRIRAVWVVVRGTDGTLSLISHQSSPIAS
ncbi:DUF4440 domain-containing protein [Actinophytocola xinjiangensis]|uniref:DUF4440 domain-containing protein n=1 Tax=Actinophytocola xinjiangensis TaxID=485602 RepID=A0A7Z0WFE7_9PSEU|nr:DUF4440 domain-containing protein [Actinophytocola xinjiangensis]